MGMKTEDLIKVIIQCAYNVRTHLAAGFFRVGVSKGIVDRVKGKRYSCGF